MGRQQRKEDRQARKRTKISATQSHAKNASGSSNSVGKQTANAGFVFNKNQFTSLINKGKARQLQHIQQQQAAAQRRAAVNGNGKDAGMDMDVNTLDDEAEGSSAAAARLRDEIVDAAATSNSHDATTEAAQEESEDAFFTSSGLQLDPTLTGKRDSSIKAYMRELRKVVDNADVLLEVLDARDPLGCRSLETERMLLRAGKKIVLILNKIDLVPKSNVEAWLRYLRHDFPTLAFKASTQSQRTNLSQGASAVNYSKPSTNAGGSDVVAGGSEAIGAGALLQLIKNYSRSLNLKTSIAVGIFGAPNVGKSSLINSLKRSRVCSVASTPGHTKVVQSVMLDKSVRLLDCPGIVFSDESPTASLGLSPEQVQLRRQSALLRNVVKVELVEDPITPVEAIMARVEPEHLMQVYGLESFQHGDAQDLLMRIAVQRGRMIRGGKIDIQGTARSVLHDWNVGKIQYCTTPPALHRSAILTESQQTGDVLAKRIGQEEAGGGGNKLEQSSAILSGFSEAFNLAGMLGEADAEVFGVGTGRSDKVLPDAPAPKYADDEEEEQQEEIEDDHEPVVEPAVVVEEADTSRRSTLGKRSRYSDESDNEQTRTARHRRVPGLDPVDDDDDIYPIPTPLEFTTDSAWSDKLAAKASSKRTSELSLAFSPSELALMAPSTGAARRKLKKLKKRADRAGAGLVGQFQEHRLGEPQTHGMQERGVGGGMFGSVVALPKKEVTEVEVVGRKGTGSMFDVLLEGQDMDSEEEEEGGKADDYEEEL